MRASPVANELVVHIKTRVQFSGFYVFQKRRVMSHAFLEFPVRRDESHLPIREIFKKARHFLVKNFGLCRVAQTLAVRRIWKQQTLRIRRAQIFEVGAYKIHALYFRIASDWLQRAPSHHASAFNVLLCVFDCVLVDVASCNPNLNVGADFFRFDLRWKAIKIKASYIPVTQWAANQIMGLLSFASRFSKIAK